MKNDATFPLPASANFTPVNINKPLQDEPRLTPYLKAILSGAVKLVNAGKASLASRNQDLDAAIRYIRESATLKK
jgi:hypothetical protein